MSVIMSVRKHTQTDRLGPAEVCSENYSVSTEPNFVETENLVVYSLPNMSTVVIFALRYTLAQFLPVTYESLDINITIYLFYIKFTSNVTSPSSNVAVENLRPLLYHVITLFTRNVFSLLLRT